MAFENEFPKCKFAGARGSRDTEVRPGPEIPAGKCEFLTAGNYKSELHAALRGVKKGVGTRIKGEIIRP